MGYSCTAKANYTLDAIGKLIDRRSSNEMPDGGFYEIGREQCDGAITGTVWKPYDATRVTRRGSFRIEPDGKVTRFPGLTADLLGKAEQIGAARFAANYGTWRERGAAMLADLESGKIDGKLSYTWFESIFRQWQSESRIMFAVMPNMNNADMAECLRGMLDMAGV